jgi:hypothetical protein
MKPAACAAGAGPVSHLAEVEAHPRARGRPQIRHLQRRRGRPRRLHGPQRPRGRPPRVLEGLMIAAYASAPRKGLFLHPRRISAGRQTRGSAPSDQARAAGLLGPNILGTGFSFDADRCGSARAPSSAARKPPSSPPSRAAAAARTAPALPVGPSGLWGKPTASTTSRRSPPCPDLARGGDGTPPSARQSKGTKVFAVTGKVRNAQLVEVPMGICPSAASSTDICGGVAGARSRACRPAARPAGSSPRSTSTPRHLREPPGTRLDHGLRRHARDG